MRNVLGLGLVAALACTILALSVRAEDSQPKSAVSGKVRHIVMFKFKDTATAEQIKSVEDAFQALPTKIPGIVGFEWGTNNSPEHLAQGFTHCFLLTFPTVAVRHAYLPHPAHKAFGKLLHPYLDKVMVIDFVGKE